MYSNISPKPANKQRRTPGRRCCSQTNPSRHRHRTRKGPEMPFKIGDNLTDAQIEDFNTAHAPKNYPTDEQGEFLPPEGKYTLQIIGGEIDGSVNTGKAYCLLFFRVLDGDWKTLEFSSAIGLGANFKWDELFAAAQINMMGRDAFDVIQNDLESPNLTFLMETAALKEKASAIPPVDDDDVPF